MLRSGVELLDAFRSLDVAAWEPRPLVHCYAFAASSKGSGDDKEAPVADLRARCSMGRRWNSLDERRV